MNPESVAVAKASYSRCQDQPDFLLAFYRQFFRICPAAEPLFARTDLDRQARLLQHALGLLLAFPAQPLKEPTVLTRLAIRHGPDDLNIDPAWYPLFLEALVTTVSAHDPQFTARTAEAWREALRPGLTYMQQYNRRPSGGRGSTA
jgi:hemoglobin-like flavoprotein